MADKNWVASLYETFVLRDLIGYAGPGSILVIGVLGEMGKIQFVKSLFMNWGGMMLLVIISYISATGLRLIGTSLRLVTFHRPCGLFGRARETNININGCLTKFERFFWRGDQAGLVKVYSRFAEDKLDSIIDREIVFAHITGLTGIALIILAGAMHFINGEGLSTLLGIPEKTLIIAMAILAFVFLLGHYRHSYQRELLEDIKKGYMTG